jgi:hypothetical protein
MGKQTFDPPAFAMAAFAVMTSVAVLSAMPPFASMAVAVVAAISWCIWLDRHPTS